MKSRSLCISLLWSLLLVPIWSCAEEPVASDALKAGTAAFKSGDFQRALESFQQARDAGSKDSLLQYNIAVCHFKLEQWSEANAGFAELYAQEPNDWLALYNLAITEKKLGRLEQAREYFFEVAGQGDMDQLALLAMRQYELLLAGKPEKIDRKWLGTVSVAYGLDDNVIDPTDDAPSQESDRFWEAMASASWFSNVDLARAWTIDGMAYASRYQQVSEYDIGIVNIGGKKHFPVGRGYLYGGADIEHIQLGSDPYQRNWSAKLGGNLPFGKRAFFNARYRYQKLNSLSEQFDPTAGSNQRVELALGSRLGTFSRWKVRYRFDDDDRQDDAFTLGSDKLFVSYSAQRHGIKLRWSRLTPRWETSLSADYRYSQFRDDNVDFDGSSERRIDQRLLAAAKIAWFFVPKWQLSFDYSYTDNQSTIDVYQFDRSLMTLGINWLF